MTLPLTLMICSSMKKVIICVLLAGLALFATSCIEPANETNDENTVPTSGDVVFHTTLADPQTKTELYQDGNALKIYWAPNDRISVFYKGIEALSDKGGSNGFSASQITASSPTADFFGTLPDVSTSTSTDNHFYAIYPYRTTGNYYFLDNNGVPTLKPQLNGTQGPAVENGVASNIVMVHAGRSSNTSIQFYNLCALFRFKITQGDDVRKIEFKGNNKELIAGAFTVQFDNENNPINLMADPTAEKLKRTINLTPAEGSAFVKNTWYYIALLPTNFTKGATVKLYTRTSTATRSIRAIEFERNHCRGAADLDGSLEYESSVTTSLTLNETPVTETTLWTGAKATFVPSLVGPLGEIDGLTWTWKWNPENQTIATLSEGGIVEAKSAGTATLIASTSFEGVEYEASCSLTVTEDNHFNALPFSISPNTTMTFAPGNLYTSNSASSFTFNSYQGQIRAWKSNKRDKFQQG